MIRLLKQKKTEMKFLAAGIMLLLTAMTASGQTREELNPEWKSLVKPQSTDRWLNFREGTTINPLTLFNDYKTAFGLNEFDDMRIKKTKEDDLGFHHYKYQQFYKNIKVAYGEFIVHQRGDGFVQSANGRLITGLDLTNTPIVSEKQGLEIALQFVHAKKYLWENEQMEQEGKRQKKEANYSYYPKGELAYSPANHDATYYAKDYRLTWKFDIQTDDPDVASKSVFVDALTGRVIFHHDISMSCSVGSGTTTWNGVKTISTKHSGSSYRSQNDCASAVAANLYVYNCNGGGASNNFYTDADNQWNNSSQASAVQCMFGVESTFNYYLQQHSRISWDGLGADMIAYNNANLGDNNAKWNGINAIFYAGNTTSASDDWNTLDIVGHEFTHGVTQDEAGLDYQKESGALNESFSDIFGEMVESYTIGSCDYLVGADRGAIRSFINPNFYGQPDTYLGTNWYTTIGCNPVGDKNDSLNYNDNCGVHKNSGVQNHWFYLLSEGGSGVNDLGNSYQVTGITNYEARLIAYRALVNYLGSSDEYIDARKASLQAAIDIYGSCSNEAIQVGNAWHAVGVESQSSKYSLNACGNFPAGGTYIQALAILNSGGNTCTTNITPSSSFVYFSSSDRIQLEPGFHAQSGSKFVAYIEPCAVTQYKGTHGGGMSDSEKGFVKNENTNISALHEDPAEIKISPNPFHSNFEITVDLNTDEENRIILYNLLGIKVRVWSKTEFTKGINKFNYDGKDLVSGVYLLEVNSGEHRSVRKLIKN